MIKHAGRCGQLQHHPTIFMRWKEHFFVNTKESCGLTIAGGQVNQHGPRTVHKFQEPKRIAHCSLQGDNNFCASTACGAWLFGNFVFCHEQFSPA